MLMPSGGCHQGEYHFLCYEGYHSYESDRESWSILRKEGEETTIKDARQAKGRLSAAAILVKSGLQEL